MTFDFIFPLISFLKASMPSSRIINRIIEQLYLGLLVAPASALALTTFGFMIWGRSFVRPKELCVVGKRRISRCCYRLIQDDNEKRNFLRRRNRVFFFALVQLLPLHCLADEVLSRPTSPVPLLETPKDQCQMNFVLPGLHGPCDSRCIPPWTMSTLEHQSDSSPFLKAENCIAPILENHFLLDELGYISAFFVQLQQCGYEHNGEGEVGSEFHFCDVQTLQPFTHLECANFDQNEIHKSSGRIGSQSHGDQDHVVNDADEYSMMQRHFYPAPILGCAHNNDPRMAWDLFDLANAVGNIPANGQQWTQIWWHTAFGGIFQRNPASVLWNPATCLRCLIEARPDLPTGPQMRGPYLVRPTPNDPAISNALQFVLDFLPFHIGVIILLVHYYDGEVFRGTLQIPHVAGWISMETLFDSVKPHHQCRGRAWCRVRSFPTGNNMELQTWWPDQILTDMYQRIKMDEINPPQEPTLSSDGTDTPGTSQQSETTLTSDCSAQACIGECDAPVSLLQLTSLLTIVSIPWLESSGPPLHEEFDILPQEIPNDIWTRFELSHGFRRFQSTETMRVHRPNPTAIARPMSKSIVFNDPVVPYDILEPIYMTWPECEQRGLRWPNWKLHPIHDSYYESGLPNLATAEYVMTIQDDNTMLTFDQTHLIAVMLHIEIIVDGPAQNILKCIRIPTRCTAQQVLDRDQTNTAFFDFQSKRVWQNDEPWPLNEFRDVVHGDYIYSFLRVRAWNIFTNVRQSNERERSRSPRQAESREREDFDSSHLLRPSTLYLSPSQSTPGECSFTALTDRPEILVNVRRIMRRHWPTLGPDPEWAPVVVHHSFRFSPFLACHEAIFILHQFAFLPVIAGRRLIALETIQIYARIARSSEVRAKAVSRHATGLEIVMQAEAHRECNAEPLVTCHLTVNARPVTLQQEIQIEQGDFAQLIIRHADMHASYQILASIAQEREQTFNPTESAAESVSPSEVAQGPEGVQSTTFAMPVVLLLMLSLCYRANRRFWVIYSLNFACVHKVAAMQEPPTVWNQVDLNTLDDYVTVSRVVYIEDFIEIPRPISLEQALEPPATREPPDGDQRSTQIPVSPEELIHFQQTWAGRDLKQCLPTPSENYPPSGIQFLLNHEFSVKIDWADFTSIQIYVDGSYNPESQKAAWAFLVIATDSNGIDHWVGWEAGVLQTDQDEKQFIGADKHCAYQAELSAIFFAAWWALSIPTDILCYFFFDNQSAGHIAQGLWIPRSNLSLPRNVRAVHQLLFIMRDSDKNFAPQYSHVKAHSGHILNDLVDAFAKDAVKSDIQCENLPDIGLLTNGNIPLLERFPLLWKLYREDQCFPEANDSSLNWRTLTTLDFEKPDFVNRGVIQEANDSECNLLQLTLYTYNVSTLDPAEGSFSAKAEFLRQQFSWRKADVAALQETRCRQQLMLETPDYLRFLSPAENGVGGTELWFLKSSSFNAGPLWSKNDFTVLLAQREILIILVESRAGKMVFVSAHAPHSASQKGPRVMVDSSEMSLDDT